jgi:hypothetical protein
LLLPDQRIGIVILINLGKAYNNASINVPIEGVAAILLDKKLTTSTNPPVNVITQMIMLAMLLMAILWMVRSYLCIREWRQRGELPLQGSNRFWRLGLPLAVDLCPVGLAWFLFPARFHTPMATIALFAPDVFSVIVTLTLLSLGWAMARIFLTIAPSENGS